MNLNKYKIFVEDVLSCNRCGLAEEGKIEDYNTQIPGQGSLDSDVMFIAQNPGAEEVKFRQPLTGTGKSGKVYERTLEKLGLSRCDVFTTNNVLCHSPKNREPNHFECKTCKPFLDRQIEMISPKLVVTFGRFSAQAFLSDFKITKDHGKLYKVKGYNFQLFPLYHPAYISVYAPQKQKQEYEEDLKKLKKIVANL